jgi:hypothetical protein
MESIKLPDGDRDGATFVRARDGKRLNAQAQRVFDVMRDGRWRSLDEIANEAKAPQASVSARLRDLRKDRFGGHAVERKHVDAGHWMYRLIAKQEVANDTATVGGQ